MAKIYLSVGSGLSAEQEAFVQALESRVQAAGMTTHTVGRNEFSSDTPLKAVIALMDECDGAIVLALERLRFESGIERPSSEKEQVLGPTSLATSWNQIEATLAYERKLPLLVLVDDCLRQDGMLEPNNDWYVENLQLDPGQLDSKEFIGRFRHWLSKVEHFDGQATAMQEAGQTDADIASRSIGDWLRTFTPAQAWGILASLAAAIAGSFALGLWLGKTIGG
ncbi:hypothetical protein [Aurantiacibacter sp. D1-12]|uniref:hypothetical protein n=1 Tax=Aurantiacibacter sp. D1-12 TaxID=2993658 RepID=UPI00237CB6B8|nr:hypothetical protein [Aurantiacibacter sp. D1-12]MDE1466370.1 hypothetical protein [Aurantiacibacter sp. D1-12]